MISPKHVAAKTKADKMFFGTMMMPRIMKSLVYELGAEGVKGKLNEPFILLDCTHLDTETWGNREEASRRLYRVNASQNTLF